MKRITVLMTRYSDWVSNFVYCITGFGYTHASLALEENEDTFYSFNWKGFAVESLAKHRRHGVSKSMSLQIEVSDAAYADMKHRIETVKADQGRYHYSRFGVFMAILRIPFQRRYHYFCSQFVAQLLNQSNAMPLRRNANVYLPNQLVPELTRFAGTRRVLCNVV